MPVAILFVIIANHFGFCPSERLKSIRKNSAKKIKIAVLYINSAFPLGSRSAIKNSHERKRYPPTAKKTVKKNGRGNFIFYTSPFSNFLCFPIFSCNFLIPSKSASGRGGQPGT